MITHTEFKIAPKKPPKNKNKRQTGEEATKKMYQIYVQGQMEKSRFETIFF